ncbi:MAG: glycerophosphodiester phosphodiesterase family protein [Cellulophaga sp.]
MEIICYGCGRGENPENTILGIKHCLSVNPDWRIEMDIQLTKDEELVLFHDYETKRITGKDKTLNKLTLKEVEKLNAGYNFQYQGGFIYREKPIQIPKLEMVFQQFSNAKLVLDVHTNNIVAVGKLIALIEKYAISNKVTIVSHYDSVVQEFRKERPNWKYGVPANEAKKMLYSSFVFLDDFFPIKSDILMLPKKFGKLNVLSKRVVTHAKKRNKQLWVWMYEGSYVKNVDSQEELIALENLGVDGVFTDYPQKLNSELY